MAHSCRMHLPVVRRNGYASCNRHASSRSWRQSMPEAWNRYGPTAARRHGRPGREVRPTSLTVDIHSHVAVPAAAALVKPYLDLSTIPLAHFATADTKALNMQQDADRTTRMTCYEERLADLDAMGLDMQVVKPPPPQCYYTVPIEIALHASRLINDGLAEYAARKS